jgi:murein DD-endopeptidase MepM/ murein hydrolase activator NlpD
MSNERLARLQAYLETLFPERHIYMRSAGEMRGLVLTTGKQVAMAAGAAALALWMGVCTTVMVIDGLSAGAGGHDGPKTRAYYERLIADRQARLNNAVAQLSDASGGVDALARTVEKRHAALALLLSSARDAPGGAAALAPVLAHTAGASPVQRVRSVLMDQDRLISQAENFAGSRAERLRLAFRMAGLNPASYTSRGDGLGGPLIEAKDPRALAAILDVDEDFAARIKNAADDMSQMRSLSDAAGKLPLAKPTAAGVMSSGFGVRFDPFTGRPALHSGLDFAGGMFTPVFSTAPGVVSFTGQRTGYGNVVEIDHGGGFKTRYAHLAAFSVHVGERVGVGQRIASMGSTGRSTGPHLHYEVWVNGRAQNPDRFVRAGDYVREATS